jgi:hypothetical protein
VTTPQIVTHYRNGARWYEHPLADDSPNDLAGRGIDPERWSPLAIGVTSVLSTLNKPFLVNWAAKMAAGFAVQEKEAWEQLTSISAKVDLIAGASKRYTKEAADTGTMAHAATERLARYRLYGGDKPTFTEQEAPFVRTYLRFEQEMKAKPLHVEQTVWNHTYGYAGTFDGIYQLGDGTPVIEVAMVDTKTGKSGVYAEVALQQVAYCNAEVMVSPTGEQVEMPKIDQAYALWLRPDGYALYPLKTGEWEWRVFLELLDIAKWQGDVGASAIRKPINPVPLRK